MARKIKARLILQQLAAGTSRNAIARSLGVSKHSIQAVAEAAEMCFVNLSFHKTASVRFTRQREDSSRMSVALAPILSSPTTPRA